MEEITTENMDPVELYLEELNRMELLSEADTDEFPFPAWRKSGSFPDPDYEEKLRSMPGTAAPSHEIRQYLACNGVIFDDREWSAVILRLGLDGNAPHCREDVCAATGFGMERVECIDRKITKPIKRMRHLEKSRKFLQD